METETKLELGWVSTNERQPARPGQYLTRRDIHIVPGKNYSRKVTMHIQPARFDGCAWSLPVQPDYWRDLPAK